MTIAIVAVFLAGYILIALEHNLKMNKTAIALLMCVVCWTLYIATCGQYVAAVHPEFDGSGPAAEYVINTLFVGHVGDTSEILFFLLGAMAVVEVVDANGGFKFVRDKLHDSNPRRLLWKIALVTFFLSAVLDNMTSSIVMVMVLRKLIPHRRLRMRYAGMVIIAANMGGVFSPIGDVTTIMLWIKGMISAEGVLCQLFVPALVATVIPVLMIGRDLRGTLQKAPVESSENTEQYSFTRNQRAAVFCVGVGGLVFVPIFRGLTGLPPFMGVLLVFGLLWLLSEIFYQDRKRRIKSFVTSKVEDLLSRIDMSTILFFLGILLAVAAMQETGVLHRFGAFLQDLTGGNVYVVNTIIGLASAVVDNVPLVASCMAMYEVDPVSSAFAVDGTFWQLLAFCAGTGGSMLIIGSIAGVVVMGLERLTFGYYLRNFSLPALLGFAAGIGVYWIEKVLFL